MSEQLLIKPICKYGADDDLPRPVGASRQVTLSSCWERVSPEPLFFAVPHPISGSGETRSQQPDPIERTAAAAARNHDNEQDLRL